MRSDHYALGMIETTGFPGLVAAADAASKAADVEVVTYQKADSGIVTIYIIGDVASVQSAVNVGEKEAARIGTLRHVHVIARPDTNVKKMIFELLNKKKAKVRQLEDKKTPAQSNNAKETHEENLENDFKNELMSKSLQELRKLAKSKEDFPIPINDIAKAKKEDLVNILINQNEEKGGESS